MSRTVAVTDIVRQCLVQVRLKPHVYTRVRIRMPAEPHTQKKTWQSGSRSLALAVRK
jgi:hypothetical protein